MNCIDLRSMTGFKIVSELTGKRAGVRDDAWELLIPGRFGDVAPYGGDLLIASTHGPYKTREILKAVPSAVVTQDGDDGQNITFPAAHFGTVAGILRLWKRRVLSEADRQKRADHMKRLNSARHAG
jgi:hypothetical protein